MLFFGTSIIHHSTEGVFLLCNILDLLIHSLDTIATSFGLKIVDYFMSSVSATTISIVVISFLLALPGRDDFKGKQEDK